MGDIISPFKAAMGGNYKTVEDRLMSAIFLRFSLPATMSASVKKQVKKADIEAAYFEATYLAGFDASEAEKLFGAPTLAAFEVEGFDKLIRPWPTQQAHAQFVHVFEEISALTSA
jgi:5'-deoxynucleotidase YfbR-like HD superfamily hydrolase